MLLILSSLETTMQDMQSMLPTIVMWVSPYLGITRAGWGGSPKALVPNLPMQRFSLYGSKIEVCEICFAMVVTQYDRPRYVKHVLGNIYMFFIFLRYWAFGGRATSAKGLVHNLLIRFFSLSSSKNKFWKR